MHVGMARPAVFGTLAEVDAGSVGLEAQRVPAAWNGVHLAAEARHPEGMDYVGAGDDHREFAPGRHVQHVRRLLAGRIAEAPAPLLGMDADRGALVPVMRQQLLSAHEGEDH